MSPKYLKITDGILKKGIDVESLEDLKTKTKTAFGYQAVEEILIMEKTTKTIIKTDTDIRKLKDLDTLVINPYPEIESHKCVRNLIEKLKIKRENFCIFTPSDFAALADLDVLEYGEYYDVSFLRDIKEQAYLHMLDEQEQRDKMGLIQLQNAADSVDHILIEVMKHPRKFCELKEDELEKLSNIDTTRASVLFGPSAKQIKGAAENRLSLMRQYRLVNLIERDDENHQISSNPSLSSVALRSRGQTSSFACSHSVRKQRKEDSMARKSVSRTKIPRGNSVKTL